MKIIMINKKILYILILVIVVFNYWLYRYKLYNRAEETFNIDVYYKGNVDDKIIAFACNVDWGNEYIQPMLDVLSEHNIKITFFVTGRWAENNQSY